MIKTDPNFPLFCTILMSNPQRDQAFACQMQGGAEDVSAVAGAEAMSKS